MMMMKNRKYFLDLSFLGFHRFVQVLWIISESFFKMGLTKTCPQHPQATQLLQATRPQATANPPASYSQCRKRCPWATASARELCPQASARSACKSASVAYSQRPQATAKSRILATFEGSQVITGAIKFQWKQ